jgi:hypothetical protein
MKPTWPPPPAMSGPYRGGQRPGRHAATRGTSPAGNTGTGQVLPALGAAALPSLKLC